MISVTDAKKIVEAASKPLPPILIPINEAAGFVLAQDVHAAIDMPPFDQSAMDGYAIAFDEHGLLKKFEIKGEVAAGSNKTMLHLPAQATRIFTGAPLPNGADTVVMQEKVAVHQNQLQITDPQLQKGSNVRRQGSELKKEALALSCNTFLTAAAVGFLAGLGVAEMLVYPRPEVAIIVTGNELQQPGAPLQAGQIYESNSVMLKAALQQQQITNVHTYFVHDDLKKLQQVLAEVLQTSDVVLLTGGVSVGAYDFVVQAAAACGVSKGFHKVAQRPGKPLYFGIKEDSLIFGLPGNPASVLTCFYQYVVPALDQVSGGKEALKKIERPLATSYKKNAGLTHFLKGWYDAKSVTPLPAQESYRLSSFATANCIITLDEWGTIFNEGDLVTVHILPS